MKTSIGYKEDFNKLKARYEGVISATTMASFSELFEEMLAHIKLVCPEHIQVSIGIKKPPIGVMPKRLWVESRKEELKGAINRYLEAGFEIPKEWVDEFNGYCKSYEDAE